MELPELDNPINKSSMFFRIGTIAAVFIIVGTVVNGAFYLKMEKDIGGTALGTTPEFGMYFVKRTGQDDNREIQVSESQWLWALHMGFWARMLLLVGLLALIGLLLSQLDHHFIMSIEDKTRLKRNRRALLLAVVIFGLMFAFVTREIAFGYDGVINKMQRSLQAYEENKY